MKESRKELIGLCECEKQRHNVIQLWARDEPLDLYFQHRATTISKTHPRVVELSGILNRLPIHADRPDRARFRNPNGVYMKMCNFLALDPTYEGKSFEQGGPA